MYTLDGLNKIFLFYQGYVLETAPAMRMVGEMCIQKIGRVVGSFPLPGSLYGSNSGHVLLMTSSKKHQNMYIYTKYNFLFVFIFSLFINGEYASFEYIYLQSFCQ